MLKLAAHGELYKIVESTDKFSEELSRTFFAQLIDGNLFHTDTTLGLEYLH